MDMARRLNLIEDFLQHSKSTTFLSIYQKYVF